jgi:hypothetical protein
LESLLLHESLGQADDFVRLQIQCEMSLRREYALRQRDHLSDWLAKSDSNSG